MSEPPTPLVEVKEGDLNLLVPSTFSTSGPGAKGREPFYNPVMALARTITVELVKATLDRRWTKFLDGLAATGILGLRVALETSAPDVILCDHNPAAVALMQRNARRNEVERVSIVCDDVRVVMAQEPFMHIEIDPFGPPTPFIDAALQALYNHGILGITATDTAPLAGTFPKTCERRYGARSARAPFGHELGLRILLGFLARSAAKFDLGLEPLLAYHAEHFYRVHARVHRGASRADEALEQLAFARWDSGTGQRSIVPRRPQGGSWAGPLWAGALGRGDVVQAMAREAGVISPARRLLARLAEEVDFPALHHGVNEWAHRLRISPPPLALIFEALRERGFKGGRTHLDPQGFRTDASETDLRELFLDLRGSRDAEGHSHIPPGEMGGDVPRGGKTVEGGNKDAVGRGRD